MQYSKYIIRRSPTLLKYKLWFPSKVGAMKDHLDISSFSDSSNSFFPFAFATHLRVLAQVAITNLLVWLLNQQDLFLTDQFLPVLRQRCQVFWFCSEDSLPGLQMSTTLLFLGEERAFNSLVSLLRRGSNPWWRLTLINSSKPNDLPKVPRCHHWRLGF